MPDIGDGLAVGIKLLDGCDLQVDCGSKQYPEQAFRKSFCRINPDIFILSHFHLDHYNGLFYCKRCRAYPHPNIKKVFFPKIPDSDETRQFLMCLFALNTRILGRWSGSRELDFLYLLSKINRCSFTYRPVSQGDLISAGGSYIEILWPPTTIDKLTLETIRKAIKDFEKARNEDEILNRIYERVNQVEFVQKYFVQDEVRIYKENNLESVDLDSYEQFLERDIPESTKQANESLRKAANHLSLAFRYNNQILFLGDLEANELRRISNDLLTKKQTHYLIIITPHHGTHWHKNLSNLSAIYAISSVGEGLFPKIKTQFRKIANICLYTYANGEIEIPHPILRPLRYWKGRYWRLYI